MPVTRLALTDFRSYAAALITPGPGFVLLSGENGAGKTNVLEAVSMLAPGRGLRGAALGEMARVGGEGGFSIAATLLPPLPLAGGDRGVGLSEPFEDDRPTPNPSREREGGIQIGTGTLAAAPERRQLRINGAAASVNALGEWLGIVWVTPAMDRLFAGSASDRRRFLDRLVLALEPGHARHAARYEAAMRARNKLLTDERPDPAWLDSLEAAMAEHGAAIGEARTRTVAGIEQRLAEVPDDDFAGAAIALDGRASGDLAAVLAANRARDSAAGRATEGPHRQDLAVIHRSKQMPAARCSTGEQKALLLVLVLAHAELVTERRGAPPLLLLDEVAAHLDPLRRAALFARLEGRGQIWLTATEHALFDGIGKASHFVVADGQVQPR